MAREVVEVYTSKEVCEMLGINSNNLKQIVLRGHIVAVKKKQGRYKCYPKSQVEAYIKYRKIRGK